MPKVDKQINVKKKVKQQEDSVWDRVKDVTEHDSGGLHMSLYGRGKTGKTRLVASFPKPVLIIGSEDGTKSISKTKGVKYIKIRHSDEVGELISTAQDHGYATLAIDTASRLADQILAELLGLEEIPEQKSWQMASRDQYAQQGIMMKTILRAALDLPLNVVIVAHERNFNEESTSDLLLPSIGSALAPSVAGWLNGAVDYICQCYIREQTIETKEKLKNGKVLTRRKTTGKPEFCLRIGPNPVYTTGFRLPEGIVLPDSLVNPTWQKINDLVQGKQVT